MGEHAGWELPEEGSPEEERLAELFGSILGGDGREILRELRARGTDFAALAESAGLPADAATLQAMVAQVQRVLSQSGDEPVNWQVAHDVARQAAVEGGDPVVGEASVREATQALSVAELWLDAVTDLPPAPGPTRVWSRSEWVEATLPTWRLLTEPVAASMSNAFAEALRDELPEHLGDGLGGGLGGAMGGLEPEVLLRQLGSAVFGLQVGQGAGTLAREVFGSTDIGLPLLPEPSTVLVPANVDDFAAGQSVPVSEVRLFLALREAAHVRLFSHVRWLRAHVLALVHDYARGVSIDLGSLEEAFRSVDVSDPRALQQAITSDVFAPQVTPAQQSALARLETVLALIEGWVDEVVAAAAIAHLPATAALREMIRRRRAAGGPGERAFAGLVGLELRPRRSREAAALFAHVTTAGGPAGREAVWDHPDLLPTAADLDDPAGFLARREAARDADAEIDQALEELLAADDAERGDGTDPEPGTGEGASGDGPPSS